MAKQGISKAPLTKQRVSNASALHGRRLGADSAVKAGKARMASMSTKQKTQHQKQAANARWQSPKN